MARIDEMPAGSGGPTLFDGLEPQEIPQTEQGATEQAAPVEETTNWDDLRRLLADTKRDAENAGVWLLLPTEALARRAEVYYNLRVERIRDAMVAAGAAPEVVGVVCSDYAGILSGQFKFKATPEQMKQALRSLKPYVAFNIDSYGLYFGLLTNYSRFLLRYGEYTDKVKGVLATEETKREYINAFYPAMDARAVRWLLNIGYFQPSDFAGFDPSEMALFFARLVALADVGEYTTYYTVARLALVATPQELAEVEAPPYGPTGLAKLCEQVVSETAEALNKAGAKFAAASATTSTEQVQAQQAGKDWRDDTNAQPVKIHQNYGIVLSQPVNVSRDGATITKMVPIKQYIDDFNDRPTAYTNIVITSPITEQAVQRVFEGVNLLPQYLSGSMIRGDNGRLEFHTNLSQFAEMCGYVDAGQTEKQALLGALLLLGHLWFVVDLPYRYREFTDRKGRKRRKQVGGPTAMKFITVPKIGLTTGDLVIEVYPESLKGTPTFITPATFKQLRSNAKSTRQSRFNYQIATKSHKSENALIGKVFGLDDMVKYAVTDEEQKRVKTYIQNHRADFRTKMLGWFAQYVDAGILTDFKREPSKTDKRDFVLSWKCPDASKLDPPPFDPEEQEQADGQTLPNG